MMLRWLIAILLVANLIALAAIEGLFGPPPAAGAREPAHLAQQVRPEALRVSATAQAAETPVVGGPITSPAIDVQPLGASAPDAASGAGPASEAAASGASAASGAAAPATAPTSGASAATPASASPAASSAGPAPAAAHAAKLDSAAPVVAAAATLAPVALVEGKKRRAAARARAKAKPHTAAPHHKTTRA
ncbi:hypothetical protein [Burkholderia plantarii]|uniref:hypothetical protein n=1 Tax=Burkholderia plantarii TaxID=41899 RepID=UPI0007067641|nr:hypothetical protein [Burkholderia plantarii]ALK32058.1 hypothetical protein bpln_1g32960 [Burkholderia plantarii]GLZ21201.1 hypothetical protein Bpla01_47300 [Burkholderia plantarii]